VSLPEGSVSTEHARLAIGEDGCFLHDLGSSNGTLVDGCRVDAETPIQLLGGERIVIGPFVLTYVPPQTTGAARASEPLARGDHENDAILPPVTWAERVHRARVRRQVIGVTLLILATAALLWVVLGEIL
jgi:hypothetical protein